MTKKIQQVLNTVRTNALESLRKSNDFRTGRGLKPNEAPHYIFSSEGALYSAYFEAAADKQCNKEALWNEFLEVVRHVVKTYNAKRLGDAFNEMAQLSPFSEGVAGILSIITDELKEIEFIKPGSLKRRHGKSRFAGKLVGKVEWHIYVDNQSRYVSVSQKKYEFTAYQDWVMTDRVLEVVDQREDGYEINITTKEWNALHGDCAEFFKKFVERGVLPQEQRKSNRQNKSDKARFRYEKLKVSR